MKIAFLVGQFPSLSETFILEQIISLISSGNDVEIFARKDPGESKIHSLVKKHGLQSRTLYFPSIPGNRLLKILKGIFLFISRFPRNPRIMANCVRVLKFRRDAISMNMLYYNIPFLNKTFDILHCHFGDNGLIGLFIKKAHPHMKLVTTFHGYDMSAFLKIRGPEVYRELFQRGDLFLPISGHWERKLISMGCDPGKIRVLHMGINLKNFRFQPGSKHEAHAFTILTVGRLVEKKGHEYVLRALAEVTRKHHTVKYIIAGDGPLRNSLQVLSRDLGVESFVDFLGECDQSEILNLYSQANLFILASVTSGSGDQEGIPVALMEAQAVGIPVISTFHSGIPEGVEHGKSGFLVPEKDPRALAERIIYLLEHADLWSEMGRHGRRNVERNFNQEALNARLEKVFKELTFSP